MTPAEVREASNLLTEYKYLQDRAALADLKVRLEGEVASRLPQSALDQINAYIQGQISTWAANRRNAIRDRLTALGVVQG